jgi:hypothetical protein
MIIKLIFENSQTRGEKYIHSENIDTVTVYKGLSGTIETMFIYFTDGSMYSYHGYMATENFYNLRNYLGIENVIPES